MQEIKLNDTIKHIFKEALLDFETGMARGNESAITHYKIFKGYLDTNEIPVSDIGFLYRYYQNQEKDLKNQIDPRLDPFKAEVKYMVNFLNSKFKFTEDSGALMVEVNIEGGV